MDTRSWSAPRRKSNEIVDLTSDDDSSCIYKEEEIAMIEQPHTKRQKLAQPIEQEKRAATYRNRPSKAFLDRVQKAQSERMFLIQQKTHTKDSVEREFVIYGSNGNVYNVKIAQKPVCNCEDNKDGQSITNCEHIIFVFLKIFHLSSGDSLIWQKALLTQELKKIFSSFTTVPSALLADPAVTEKYLEIMRAERSRKKKKHAAQKPVEGDCPICFEKMTAQDELVFCKFSCGNSLHKSCFTKWQDSRSEESQEVKCIYCRARWDQDYEALKKAHTKNGYLNLAAFQERDLRDHPAPYLILLPDLLRGFAERNTGPNHQMLIRTMMDNFAHRMGGSFWGSDSDDDDYSSILQEEVDSDSDDSEDSSDW